MIDYKELSVGDWVINTEFGKKVIDRVECVEKSRVFLEHAKLYTPINYIEPIPLTETILEKNEFENCVVYSNIHFYKSNDKRIEVSDNEELLNSLNKWYIRIWYISITTKYHGHVMMPCEITYVHELQHALRLCGIEKEIEL